MVSKYRNAGQTCVCANRLYVQDKVYDAFVAKLAEKARGIKVGNGFESGVNQGPLIDDQAIGKVERHDTKTIETTVQLPPDMLPHMAEVFAERDRLYTDLQVAANVGTTSDRQTDILQQYHEALKDDPIILKGPTFNALLLPWAIENVRKQLASDNEARKKS